MKRLLEIFRWAIGLFLILLGLGGISSSNYIWGLVILFVGIIFIPPINEILKEKKNFQSSFRTKKFLLFILLVVGFIIISLNPSSEKTHVPKEREMITYNETTILELFPTRDDGVPLEYEIREVSKIENVSSSFKVGYSRIYLKNGVPIFVRVFLFQDDVNPQEYFNNEIKKLQEIGGYKELRVPENCYGYKKSLGRGMAEKVKIVCYKNNGYIIFSQAYYYVDEEELIELTKYI